ncbi:uncharacterized protein G2W53_042679 [Senna tora]|uniref:Uncharacterized protein n=1 Tax=Senna tora TaxID=362788 RepID=A0A834VZ60_9FABA|nr:uncharacterized protein G2W53_042679 [Senna tora]
MAMAVRERHAKIWETKGKQS